MTAPPLVIGPGQAPGGVMVHVVTGCGVVLVQERLTTGPEVADQGERDAELATAHQGSCPCGTVALWAHDGDTGRLMYAEVMT